nr:FtsX-like permease family protein [Gemmatimonadota bacterium]
FGGRVHPVVGVLPPGPGYPAEPALITAYETDAAEESRTAHNWRAVGRLAGGVTVEAAQRELSAIAAQLKRTHGDDTWMSDAAVVPLRDEIVGAVRPALLVLLGAAAFLFLIAGANVASLLLTRAAGRQREMAVRRALGASRRRIVQGALAESLLLSLTACAVGVVLALWAVDLLRALAPATLPRTSDIRVDSLVLSVALAGSLLTAGGLGMAIGARAMRGGLREALSERRGGGSGAGRARALLVSGQMALTVVLLVGAMLLGRSLLRLLAVDPGYRTSGATVLSLALDWPESPADASRQLLFHDELIARLGALPGVTSVGGVNSLPLGHGFGGAFLLLERPDEVASFDDFQALSATPSRVGYADYRVATGGYFPAMRIRLLRGRLFDERDHVEAPHVAVVSESLARSTWPGQDPLGRLIQFGNMDGDLRAFTVVGVVSDVRQGGLEGEVGAIVYGSARQRIGPAANLEVVIHGPSDPRTVIPAARQIMRELGPDIPLRLLTLDELFARSIEQRRFSLLLFALFGGTALLLAMIGLYGVVSSSIAQRTHEIGVRIALGAQSADVTGLVIRQGAVLAGAGILAGLLAALALSRLVAGLLFGVTATDPLAFAAVALLLAAVALLASYLPARRATRVDPIQALRAE